LNPLSQENRRFLAIVINFLPVVLRYRADRREIRREEGRISNPEKYRRHGEAAVRTFIKLGPTFIKLGQLLSVRPDVLPQPYIEEFAKLQDEVPAAPFDRVRQLIESELGAIDKVFDSFDSSAVTGASLGQVYRAVYRGQEVVVKVNRPGVRELVELDIRVLRRLVPLVGRFIDRNLMFSVESVLDQFSETVQEELDYKKEAENLMRIKQNLRGERDVIIPSVYPDVSTTRVLVMQYVGGIKVSDVDSIDRAGLDRRKLARRVSTLFFRMLLSQDIFHADPHPGNISVTQDGRLVLYDFGMIGQLDEETRTKLVRFYTALSEGSSSRIVDMMIELGVLQPTANRFVIQSGVELALADMQGKKVEETEVKALIELANRTIYQFPFKLPKNLVLYMRMISILEGVCLRLDPDFRFIRVLGRLLEKEGLAEEAYREELRSSLRKVGNALISSIEVAPMLKAFLERHQDGQGKPSDGGGHRGYLSGLLAGAGAIGLFVSLIDAASLQGKVGLALSLLSLVTSVAAMRR
jgi:predicted unusual protein kinase regulating ubiquinone biosynthesis (AarF/ABC1/UbiB family)